MSVRKRTWKTRKGEAKEAWVVDYIDGAGGRHLKTFTKKKNADAYQAQVKVDVGLGVHVAPSKSITLKEAASNWIKSAEANGLERSTVEQYRQHAYQHMVPFIGRLKLSEISAQTVRKFETTLRDEGRSQAMVRKVIGSLGAILADAQERGGLHALRHFYASWCINREKDGGLGLPPKNVQQRLGHSSITITLDTYGHLFKGDDVHEISAAEEALIARSAT